MAEKKPTAKVKSGVIKTPETKKAPAAPAKAAPEKKEAVKAAAAVKAPKRKQGIPRRILGGAMRFAGRKLTQKKTPKKGLLFFKR